MVDPVHLVDQVLQHGVGQVRDGGEEAATPALGGEVLVGLPEQLAITRQQRPDLRGRAVVEPDLGDQDELRDPLPCGAVRASSSESATAAALSSVVMPPACRPGPRALRAEGP